MDNSIPGRVVVIGGGISGLVAARELEAGGVPEVVVLEAGLRPGGVIRTLRLEGSPVEAGPDWFPTNRPAAVDLCKELGLEGELVAPAASGALIWRPGGFKPMPKGFVRGVPASLGSLLRCNHLSFRGRLRGMADLWMSGPLSGPDISVAQLVRRRFGEELLDRVVDPILAASRSGAPHELSLASAAPELDAAARSSRTVMGGLRSGTPEPPGFVGIEGGMGHLVDRLIDRFKRADIRIRTRAESVRRTAEGYEVSIRSGDAIAADAVVVALPAYAAAPILSSLDEALAAEVGGIRYTSAIVASFLYPPRSVPAPAGASGWLVPRSARRLMTACAWFSRKWAHVRPASGGTIMRCFAGREENDPVLELDDNELQARLAAEIAEATGATTEPVDAIVTRWDRSLPLFEVGHIERMKRIDALLAHHPEIALGGGGLPGSGIVDCITQAGAAARRILRRAR